MARRRNRKARKSNEQLAGGGKWVSQQDLWNMKEHTLKKDPVEEKNKKL